METKKKSVKTGFPEESQEKILPNEKLMVQVSYDLLQVAGFIEETKPLETESEIVEKISKKKVHVFDRFPMPKKPRKNPYSGRNAAANPAPPSRTFQPDWIDLNSEVELSLATNSPIVDEKKRSDKNAIVFWCRASGHRRDGRPKQFPLSHETVKLMDIRTGDIVGTGFVAERYFTRGRVMGVLIMRPLMWNPEAPFYSE